MNIENKLRLNISSAFKMLYNYNVEDKDIQIQPTSSEFKGSYTVVLFPFSKLLKKNPEQIGEEIGNYLLNNSGFLEEINVVKGFLNIDVNINSWVRQLQHMYNSEDWGFQKSNKKEVMIEFSSPNTNVLYWP